MPSSVMHLCVAKEVTKHIKVKEEEFFYGNILPDQLIEEKNYKKKDKFHFYDEQMIGNIKKQNVNLEKFLSQYKNELIDSVSLGVYSHLITDYLWIENFTRKHLIKINDKIYIKSKKGNIRNNRITVHKDYDRMNKWLIPKYDISVEFIKKVKYKGIFTKIYDLPHEEIYEKMNRFMNEFINDEMKIFTQNEIDEFIQTSSKSIIDKLKDIQKKEG